YLHWDDPDDAYFSPTETKLAA
ncbi:unnamed protein product, partial [Mesorhabditis belari]